MKFSPQALLQRPGPQVEALLARLTAVPAEPAVLVRVTATQGSAPREAGTWMAVWTDGALVGTIGGGHVEYQAVARAQALLSRAQVQPAGAAAPADGPLPTVRYALGPSLGQCCGGVMHLSFERVAAGDAAGLALQLAEALTPVALFGGGHVGHALARVLAPLPFELIWVDSRDGVFPAELPPRIACEHADPVQSAVLHLAAGSRVLVMSFSHAEDLDVVAACLQRQRERGDLPFIGLIGSRSKWANFRRRLAARGFSDAELAHVTCPIGVAGIAGKAPEVIAVAVAAQLLQTVNAG